VTLGSLRRPVFVCGLGETGVVAEDPRSIAEMVLQAVQAAYADAGCTHADVDAVVSASIDLLDGLKANNTKGEYYLTDIVALAGSVLMRNGRPASVVGGFDMSADDGRRAAKPGTAATRRATAAKMVRTSAARMPLPSPIPPCTAAP